MGSILVPRRCFIDTGHLINLSRIAENRPPSTLSTERVEAYRRVANAIREGSILPIVVFDQPDEWRSNENARRICRLLDEAFAVFELADLRFVFGLEVLHLLNTQVGTSFEPPEPIQPLESRHRVLQYLIRNAKGLGTLWSQTGILPYGDAIEIRPSRCFLPATRAEFAERQRSMSVFEIGVDADLDQVDRHKRNRFECLMERLDRSPLIRDLLETAGLNPRLSESMACEVLRDSTCFEMWSRVYWMYLNSRRDRTRHRAGDFTDLGFLHVYELADYSLTERFMRGLVCQAQPRLSTRVHSDPQSLLKALSICES